MHIDAYAGVLRRLAAVGGRVAVSRECGWSFFTAIARFTNDKQASYALAETLKNLDLLHSPEHHVSLEKYALNTEAQQCSRSATMLTSSGMTVRSLPIGGSIVSLILGPAPPRAPCPPWVKIALLLDYSNGYPGRFRLCARACVFAYAVFTTRPYAPHRAS